VSWAHPKFGRLLASCSFDKRVVVWKETAANIWSKLYEYDKHESSVNCVAWAPHELGLVLACGSSDGSITILTHKGDNVWDPHKIQNAHPMGVNGVSWASATTVSPLSSSTNAQQAPVYIQRFVSGGCDNFVKIWRHSDMEGWRMEEPALAQHTHWVRDVAWAPSIGLPSSNVASCSEDGTVVIWTQENSSSWGKKVLPKFADVVWRVSWSLTGNLLAVSSGDNRVTLWKESNDGEWKCISDVEDNSSSPS